MDDQDQDDDLVASQWHRDSEFPMDWWQSAVANGDTSANYLDWVLSMYEEEGKDPPKGLLDEIERTKDDDLPFVPAKYKDRFPEEDWKIEVENLDTRLGYESWVVSQLQFDDEWLDEQDRIDRAQQQGATLDEQTPAAPNPSPRPRM